MKIKHLQLNTHHLRAPERVAAYANDLGIDIACLQEIVYPKDEVSPMKTAAESVGYEYAEGINYYHVDKGNVVAEAIISKYPIIDSLRLYYNSDTYKPEDLEGALLVREGDEKFEFPRSRGFVNSVKPRCILICLIETPAGIVRVITTHYNVSDKNTELRQMYEMSVMIAGLVDSAKALPTIFSGDLNISPQSYSVTKLSESMDCHTDAMTDTLSSQHPAKKHDFPEGLAVDHVFSKHIKHIATVAEEVDFSAHKAIVSGFAL